MIAAFKNEVKHGENADIQAWAKKNNDPNLGRTPHKQRERLAAQEETDGQMKVPAAGKLVRAGRRSATSQGVETRRAGSSFQNRGLSPALRAFEAASSWAPRSIGIQNGTQRSLWACRLLRRIAKRAWLSSSPSNGPLRASGWQLNDSIENRGGRGRSRQY